MFITLSTRWRLPAGRVAILLGLWACSADFAQAQLSSGPSSIVHMVQSNSDRVEMTIHSSRMLTLDLKIPRAQVNNPDLLDLTPISAKQVQIYAKKAGVTQVNLWDEKGEIHSIDVIIFGDVRELTLTLQSQFPNASIKVFPTATSVILSGYVDRPDHVSKIIRMAEDYYPKVINNITVGGAQQVMLHVKVMEVSRTKLRNMGIDFAQFSSGDFVSSTVSNIITRSSATTSINRGPGSFATSGTETMQFGVLNANASFFGFIQALQQNNLIKTLAEPTLVTVSGRPAYFLAGGSIPYPIPSGLGTTSVAFKDYGTQVDFVPIVLGNGNVRLEVRPQVSAIDYSTELTINGSTVPGFTVSTVDTGVELKVGQTLALAGLIQSRIESTKRQIPWIGDLPVLGTLFRSVSEQNNEIELLILVRPELAQAMECDEVPPLGPGQNSEQPNDWDLYINGHLEVPLQKSLGSNPAGVGPGGAATESNPQGARGAEIVPPGQPAARPEPELPSPDTAGDSAAARRGSGPVAQSPGSGRPASRAASNRGNADGRTPAANAAYPTPTTGSPYNPAKPNGRPVGPKNSSSDPPGFIGSTGYDVTN
jgi:pilus assembly protein CpaC